MTATQALAAIDSTGIVRAIRRTPRTYTHAILAPGRRWSEDAKGYVPTAPIVQTWCGRPDLAAKALANYPGGVILTVRVATKEEVAAERKATAKPKRTIRAVLDGVVLDTMVTQRSNIVAARIDVYADLGVASVEVGAEAIAKMEAESRAVCAKYGWEFRPTTWTPETLVASRHETFLRDRWGKTFVLPSGEVAVVQFGNGEPRHDADLATLSGYRLIRTARSV